MTGRPKVSAIVSVYKAERFLAGCLDDLERQSIADRVEIVVVNSGSPQGEDAIVREYLGRYDNIVYVRTEETETVYGAWNRAIRYSTGEYLTTANTDDRHKSNALAVMAKELDREPDVALVYAGYHVTRRENETFEHTSSTSAFMPLPYDRNLLLRGYCFPGPQPMWRRSVHDEYGYFDDTLRSAGDLEFWLRISQRHPFRLVPKMLGLYLEHAESAEHRDWDLSQQETAAVLAAYRQQASGGGAG